MNGKDKVGGGWGGGCVMAILNGWEGKNGF